MRRIVAGSVGLAWGLSGMAAAAGPEVIASSSAAPPAALGVPRPGGLTVRGKAQEQLAPPASAPPAAPGFAPMPSSTTPGQPPIAPPVGPPLPPGAVPVGPPKPAGPALPGPMVGPVSNDFSMAGVGQFFAPGTMPLNQQRWYFGAEYLYWWTRDGALPPIVTTGDFNDLIPGSLSGITGPSTQVLYGNDSLNTQGRSGARFTIGRWFGDGLPWAIELGGFFLGDRTASFADSSRDGRVLARPFFESNRNRPNAELIAAPGLDGGVSVETTTSFYGANADWRRRLWCPELCGGKCGPRAFRLDGTVGFRYLNLDESLTIFEQSVVTAPAFGDIILPGQTTPIIIPAGLGSQVTDTFRVDNDFYGASVGLIGNYNVGRWSLGMGAKVALGNTRQQLEIAGGQVITYPTPPGGVFNFPGGLAARPSNIGTYSRDVFTVVPEVNFNVGYQFTNNFKMFVGYDFLYWNKVLRAGDQIDTTVNLAGIPYAPQPGQRDADGNIVPPGQNRPAVLFTETDFWAQGISLGMLFTW